MKNPAAFPRPFSGTTQYAQDGMTLRDYFAAKAMQGMMVDVHIPDCNYIAKTAYEMADAMLKARGA
jgi:hypothetical protein